MNTVILKWNPAISSYSMFHYLYDIRNLVHFGESDFDWSVWDYDKIHKGDKYYWLKVGKYGQLGIVGTGVITSEPFNGDDWSGQDRPTYYVNYEADILLNPDALPILTATELTEAIPDFDWNGGHSGLVLSPEQAEKLDALWEEFMEKNAEEIEKAKNLGRGDQDLVYMK